MKEREPLLNMLFDLEGVWQDPVFHPEGDALYHSLQVFQQARHTTDDPDLWAAALLHDIGKSVQNEEHASIGAEMLEGHVSTRVLWLIEHHMDLLYDPKPTRRQLRGSPLLRDLEQLRQWDVAGREPHAWVLTPEEAIDILVETAAFTSTPRKGKR